MSQNYAEWLYKFDRGTHAPTTPPEEKWTREQTLRAVIEDFKDSPFLKQEGGPNMDQDQIWEAIQRQARAAFPQAESEADAVTKYLETDEGNQLYNAYLDAQAEHTQPEPRSEGSEPTQGGREDVFQKQRAALRKAHPTMSDAQAMDTFLRTPEGARFYEQYLNSRG